ncbi:hypothetical protein P153DRAFT_368433 [Dothidotthia symphoricarpi CBS 119687]|uniref:Uncharacterized protein n=1 Tax=Dothidotthia symphoricarpi CBS 119687 TaxID=1392245 RepID=A0A6A6A8W3_9PLEO|nr:uncharacterized protein P153DRAFT_368433 [Dothidotthia symphoricarpi CBS 119687]KAF2127091.1 hypothetical protein P153DRAFT_368433 [Dothidotthia symphoricarpi CBS 119687]
MGIPIGYNIRRDEEQDKERDVLRADVTGHRSPIRRRVRPDGRSRLAPPPVPEVTRNAHRVSESARNPPSLQRYHEYLSRRDTEERAMRMHTRPLAALTPGFAPATAARTRTGSAGARRRRSRSPQADELAYRRRDDSHEGLDSSADSHAVGFPRLRRMGRRTIADGPLPSSSLRESWSPASTLDGLGDRDRSLSPFEETLPWDTFLSTVVPDPVAPTADSSFASAAASASFSHPNSTHSSRAGSSNSHSASSSHTHLTVPSRRQSETQFMRACESSSDDTASDTEEDEIIVRPNPATSRRRARPSYFSSEPPMRDTERYSHRVLERSRAANAYVSRFYSARTAPERPLEDQLDGPVELTRATSDAHGLLDQELRDARLLLERLTRRDDVSDDFWASVGLTRSFADGVERLQERE